MTLILLLQTNKTNHYMHQRNHIYRGIEQLGSPEFQCCSQGSHLHHAGGLGCHTIWCESVYQVHRWLSMLHNLPIQTTHQQLKLSINIGP